jgi:hypothetical protein
MASAPVEIPYRPAGVLPATNLMNVDGLCVVNLGRQHLHVTLREVDGTDLDDVRVYVESFSDPGISFVPGTVGVGTLRGGAELPVRFSADFSRAAPAATFVSFVVEAAGHQPRRIIKKIFVTRVDYDKPTKTYTVQTPQGQMGVAINNLILGTELPGGGERPGPFPGLIQDVTYTLRPAVPYGGAHGPLMFDDPWWKIALAIVAGLILAGAAFYDYFSDGTLDGGSVSVGLTARRVDGRRCCTKGVGVSSSAAEHEDDLVAKGLYSAAGSVATVAIASDDPDLHWRGQEATDPPAGERTVAEGVRLRIAYVASPSPGVPFAIEGDWEYTRTTDAGTSYDHAANDRRENTHVLERYEVDAPARHERADGPLVVRASFVKPGGAICRGGELRVTGHLVSDQGDHRQFDLNDGGGGVDDDPNDGVYSGAYTFAPRDKGDPDGRWFLFVIAQDVNTVAEGTDPFRAAHTVGGIVVTDQLRMGVDEPCELNPDAEIEVA